MNEQEKSIKLAKLMGWELDGGCLAKTCGKDLRYFTLNPYADNDHGQFKAIILNFPAWVSRTVKFPNENPCFMGNHNLLYQDNILDEILRMNGVDIDDARREEDIQTAMAEVVDE
ncbi:MAG: hypothetical protein ABUJ92_00630 [Desulfobacterales bacterium]